MSDIEDCLSDLTIDSEYDSLFTPHMGDAVDAMYDSGPPGGYDEAAVNLRHLRLWARPPAVRDDLSSCDEEALYAFEPMGCSSEEVAYGAIVREEPLLEWADEAASAVDEPEARAKPPPASRDAATTQDREVIRGVVDAVAAQGGLGSATFAYIDFEATYVASADVCAPCEVGITAATLSLDDVPGVGEHEKDDSHMYHRIMVPGVVPLGMRETSELNQLSTHGLPYGEEGVQVSLSARTPMEAYEILEELEWLLERTAAWHAGGGAGRRGRRFRAFRKARREGLAGYRRAVPVGPTCRALLFGWSVGIERSALTSLAHVARNRDGAGPFRWEVPVYDITHLVQALHLMAAREGVDDAPLLTPSALEGITLWASGRVPLPGGARTASPCKYHRFLHHRAVKYGVFQDVSMVEGEPVDGEDVDMVEAAAGHDGFHCALCDAATLSERVRFIAVRYFPSLLSPTADYRHPVYPADAPWPFLPPTKKPTPAPELQTAIDDLVARELLPAGTSEFSYAAWHGVERERIFRAVDAAVREGRVEDAGRLTRAWHRVANSKACGA